MTRVGFVKAAVGFLLVVGAVGWLVAVAGSGAEADRPVFFEGGLADVPQPSEVSPLSDVDPVFTQGGRSDLFAELVAPLMMDGAVLVHAQGLHDPRLGVVDDAWFEMPDGAVVLVSRQYVGSDFSAPLDLVFMGREGWVEDWGDGVEAAISTSLRFAEVNVVAGEWMLSVVAQSGPVWFGEGDPPAGFLAGDREGGEILPVDDLRSVAQLVVEQGTAILGDI